MSTSSNPGSNARATRSIQLALRPGIAPDTKVHLHLTEYSHALVLLLQTSGMTGSEPLSLSSLAYSLPNVSLCPRPLRGTASVAHERDVVTMQLTWSQQLSPSSQPLSTTLYSKPDSADFMTRLAKMLAKKTQKPAYVGGNVKFWVHEDEMDAMKSVLDAVTNLL